jgi:hypothetical protein
VDQLRGFFFRRTTLCVGFSATNRLKKPVLLGTLYCPAFRHLRAPVSALSQLGPSKGITKPPLDGFLRLGLTALDVLPTSQHAALTAELGIWPIWP